MKKAEAKGKEKERKIVAVSRTSTGGMAPRKNEGGVGWWCWGG